MKTVFDQLSSEKQRRLFQAEVKGTCEAFASHDETEEQIAKAFFRGVQSCIDGERPDWRPDDIRDSSGQRNAFGSGYRFAANVFSSCDVSSNEKLFSY
jgi:hypothetical protein